MIEFFFFFFFSYVLIFILCSIFVSLSILVVFTFNFSLCVSFACVCVRSFLYVVVACVGNCVCVPCWKSRITFGLNSLLTWKIICIQCLILGN